MELSAGEKVTIEMFIFSIVTLLSPPIITFTWLTDSFLTLKSDK